MAALPRSFGRTGPRQSRPFALTFGLVAAALAAALSLTAAPAAAQTAPPGQPSGPLPGQPVKPDPARGAVIAQRWCAECHVVSRSQTSAKADVPTFSAIAARGGVTEETLRRFLMNPHPVMPDMQLGRTEAADLAAWIEDQKP